MAPLLRTYVTAAAVIVCHLAAQAEPRSAPAYQRATETKQPYTLEEITGGVFSARGFNGTWISGTEFIFTDSATRDIYKYNVSSGNSTLFVSSEILGTYEASLSSISADGKYLLLSYGRQSGFRYSSLSKFVIYSTETSEYYEVAGDQQLSLARWGPSGSALVFVRDNDIYYKASANGSETQLTFTGLEGVLYNGVADWVYEEEVLSSYVALWFSPNGSSLAYVSFNDSDVRIMTYDLYGTPGSLDNQYPELVSLRYPKAGTPNPVVTLNVVSLLNVGSQDAAVSVQLPAPVALVTEEHIIYSAQWVSEDQVVAVWTNRRQNLSATISYILGESLQLQETSQLLSKAEPEGWLSPTRLLFEPEGRRFVTILSQSQDEQRGDFDHVTLVSNDTQTALTSGTYVVTSIYGWDHATGSIYYLATGRDSSTQRHVYVVSEDGSTDACLSCSLQTPEGNLCRYASASFSADLSHYALVCSGPDPAFTGIYKTSEAESRLVLWEDNAVYRENVSARSYPQMYTAEVPVSSGLTATARLWLPPGLDTSGSTKYPLLVFVYGGPNSKQINDAFTLSFGTYLATNRSIIYSMIDGRGSGMRGNTLKFQVNRRLGTVEIEDQISVTRWLQETLAYIDANRTGIWGWSYGGYATAMTLAKDTEGVFIGGASVAPVTSWIYYDSVYTERYMGLPTFEDNEVGYNQSDVTRLVDNFREKQYLLIHGTGDDNVHYQQSMALARSLELADILFSELSYPDENHGIGRFTLHVYRTMDNFWKKCFK